MPIRSPRGRGAAYRSVWQWPLRSPARLIGCGVALVVVLIGVNSLLGLAGIRHSGGLLGTTGPTATTPAKPGAPRGPAAAPTTESSPTAIQVKFHW